MAAPDDNEISPYLRPTPRSEHEAECQREARAARGLEAQRQRLLDRAIDRLSCDELRYEAGLLSAESRDAEDPDQRKLLAEYAFELAQLAERRERLLRDMPAAAPKAPVSANENVNRLLDKARRWRMRAEEYRTIAEALQHPAARESYLHLARTYDALAGSYEARTDKDHLVRNIRKPDGSGPA